MRSSRYAPTRDWRKKPVREEQRVIQTRSSKPPAFPSPALVELRRRWYASNPWKRDWQANWEAHRGARACFLERGSA